MQADIEETFKNGDPMKDINKMTISELEKIASDERTDIPSYLESSIEELADGLEAVRRLTGKEERKPLLLAGVAASAAILACAALGLQGFSGPEDTFDDPELAYAEARKAMQMIADALDTGADRTNEAMAAFERQKDILEKMMK